MKKLDYTIRKAKLSDFKEVLSLYYKLKRFNNALTIRSVLPYCVHNKAEFEKIFKKQFRSRNFLILVAELNNKIEGYMLVKDKKEEKHEKIRRFAYIFNIYVEKKYRGKGIASALRNEMKKWAKKRGIKHTSLHVFPKNKSAIKIYNKWGYCDCITYMVGKLK